MPPRTSSGASFTRSLVTHLSAAVSLLLLRSYRRSLTCASSHRTCLMGCDRSCWVFWGGCWAEHMGGWAEARPTLDEVMEHEFMRGPTPAVLGPEILNIPPAETEVCTHSLRAACPLCLPLTCLRAHCEGGEWGIDRRWAESHGSRVRKNSVHRDCPLALSCVITLLARSDPFSRSSFRRRQRRRRPALNNWIRPHSTRRPRAAHPAACPTHRVWPRASP